MFGVQEPGLRPLKLVSAMKWALFSDHGRTRYCVHVYKCLHRPGTWQAFECVNCTIIAWRLVPIHFVGIDIFKKNG